MKIYSKISGDDIIVIAWDKNLRQYLEWAYEYRKNDKYQLIPDIEDYLHELDLADDYASRE